MDSTLPEIRIHNPQTEPAPEPEPAVVAAAAPEHSAIRRYLLARGNSAVADRVFKVLMLLCALSIFVIVALIAYQLIDKAQLNWTQSGMAPALQLHRMTPKMAEPSTVVSS